MSIAGAGARHAFGLKGEVCGNISYVDEQTIVYPCGANTVLYNIDQKSQKFIPGRLVHILGQRGSSTLKTLGIFYLTSVHNLTGSFK